MGTLALVVWYDIGVPSLTMEEVGLTVSMGLPKTLPSMNRQSAWSEMFMMLWGGSQRCQEPVPITSKRVKQNKIGKQRSVC